MKPDFQDPPSLVAKPGYPTPCRFSSLFFSRSVLYCGSSAQVYRHPIAWGVVHLTTQFNWCCDCDCDCDAAANRVKTSDIHLAFFPPLSLTTTTVPRKKENEHHSAHVNHTDANHSLPPPMHFASCRSYLSSSVASYAQISPGASCLRLHFCCCNCFSMRARHIVRICDKQCRRRCCRCGGAEHAGDCVVSVRGVSILQ